MFIYQLKLYMCKFISHFLVFRPINLFVKLPQKGACYSLSKSY